MFGPLDVGQNHHGRTLYGCLAAGSIVAAGTCGWKAAGDNSLFNPPAWAAMWAAVIHSPRRSFYGIPAGTPTLLLFSPLLLRDTWPGHRLKLLRNLFDLLEDLKKITTENLAHLLRAVASSHELLRNVG